MLLGLIKQLQGSLQEAIRTLLWHTSHEILLSSASVWSFRRWWTQHKWPHWRIAYTVSFEWQNAQADAPILL